MNHDPVSVELRLNYEIEVDFCVNAEWEFRGGKWLEYDDFVSAEDQPTRKVGDILWMVSMPQSGKLFMESIACEFNEPQGRKHSSCIVIKVWGWARMNAGAKIYTLILSS